METKDKFYLAFIGILIVILLWLSWRVEAVKSAGASQADELKRSIIASDSLVKEANGRYAKLEDYYKSERDLTLELKNSNRDLYNTIMSQGERILNLTSSVISLKGEVSNGFGKFNPADSSQIGLALKYPEEKDPFIKWDGFINKNTASYRGNWSFGKLPIQIVVTEDKRGLWKNRIVGPDWLIIDSLQVNSLPPDKYVPEVEKKIEFILGASYSKPIFTRDLGTLGIAGGISILSQHNLMLTLNTREEVGLAYYYKFKSIKKNK